MATTSTSISFTPILRKWISPVPVADQMIYMDGRINRDPTEYPFGEATWRGLVNTPGKLSANVAELLVTLVVPPNFRYRFTKISGFMTADGTSALSVDNWSTTLHMAKTEIEGTQPGTTAQIAYGLSTTAANNFRLAAIKAQYFGVNDLLKPGLSSFFNGDGNDWLIEATDTTGDDTIAVTFNFDIRALLYTQEQYFGAKINFQQPVLS